MPITNNQLPENKPSKVPKQDFIRHIDNKQYNCPNLTYIYPIQSLLTPNENLIYWNRAIMLSCMQVIDGCQPGLLKIATHHRKEPAMISMPQTDKH